MPDTITFDDIEPAQPTDAELRTVATLTARLAALQDEKERLEASLKETNKMIQQVSENDLPEALIAAGHTCPSKEVIAGHKIDFSEKFRCGQLDSDKNPDGARWLHDNGHGDILKATIAIGIPRGDASIRRELVDLIRAHPAANQISIDWRETCPWNTLAGFVKEQCDEGRDPPLDTLKVQRVRSVKVM